MFFFISECEGSNSSGIWEEQTRQDVSRCTEQFSIFTWKTGPHQEAGSWLWHGTCCSQIAWHVSQYTCTCHVLQLIPFRAFNAIHYSVLFRIIQKIPVAKKQEGHFWPINMAKALKCLLILKTLSELLFLL